MRIRNKYLIAFLSSTLITFMVVGVSLWGFHTLQKTTDYLVTVNSRVLEFSSYYDKELAHSRRAEKEFFIFPNNEAKQEKYIGKWKKSYAQMRDHLTVLEEIFRGKNNIKMLELAARAKGIMDENEAEFATVVSKFKRTKSYDTVNKAEYGTFKKKTHILEDIAVKISQYGLSEVQEGRKELATTQQTTQRAIQIIAVVAILWGVLIPVFLSRRFTSIILYLTQVSNDISMGKMGREIRVRRRDELGDLARSIQRMQTSLRIMLDKFKQSAA